MVSIRMNVTVPKEIISIPGMRDKIARALRTKTGPELRTQFKKTTGGWEHKPDWSQKMTDRTNYLSVSVWASGPNADQYGLVNAGSPPHMITGKTGGLLKFQPGYRAATKPGKLMSRAAQRSGDYISTPVVSHPGFEGRAFDEAVAEKVAPSFAKDVQDAIRG